MAVVLVAGGYYACHVTSVKPLQADINVLTQEKNGLVQEKNDLLKANNILTQRNNVLVQDNNVITQENTFLKQRIIDEAQRFRNYAYQDNFLRNKFPNEYKPPDI